MDFLEFSEKPDDWPANNREIKLDAIYSMLQKFKDEPNYKNRELLISLASDHDLNETNSLGLMRITEYEVGLINCIYILSNVYQINSVKVYLYDLISETTHIKKLVDQCNPALGINDSEEGVIDPYNGLELSLKLYYFAYHNYIYNKGSFCDELINIVKDILNYTNQKEEFDSITKAYVSMMNDISYMRGSKRQSIWKFNRKELFDLFTLEAKLLKLNHESAIKRPTKGVLMTQISNFILKSRNGYNEDYICKYVPVEVARQSIYNHEIWMRKTSLLNDEREQKVVPELFEDSSWIDYDWVKNIDFSSKRTYYVSSFSKSIDNSDMENGYGQCLYGYKNDRISELISPIGIYHLEKKEGISYDGPNELEIPFISQTIVFDVIYDLNEAKEELKYLFSIIDLFDLSDNQKRNFLEEIMQYWILSVKDKKWSYERERRYVIFMYDGYDYKEMKCDESFLKVKTSIFLMPDFIIGENPSRYEIENQLRAKREALSSKEYLFCEKCLMQNYDIPLRHSEECPICKSRNIKLITTK